MSNLLPSLQVNTLTLNNQARKASQVLVVLSLQVPDHDVSGAAAGGGAKSHYVGSAPGYGDLGNEVLTTTHDGTLILEGGGTEDLDVDDVTLASVRVSKHTEAMTSHLNL